MKRACSLYEINKSTLCVRRLNAFVVGAAASWKNAYRGREMSDKLSQRDEPKTKKKNYNRKNFFYRGLTRWRFIVYFNLFWKYTINIIKSDAIKLPEKKRNEMKRKEPERTSIQLKFISRLGIVSFFFLFGWCFFHSFSLIFLVASILFYILYLTVIYVI